MPFVDTQESLTPILEKIIDVTSSDKNCDKPPKSPVHRNLVLQKEVNYVARLILQGKDNDVPFTPYLSNSQEKKTSKDAYQTRSRGLPPSHQ